MGCGSIQYYLEVGVGIQCYKPSWDGVDDMAKTPPPEDTPPGSSPDPHRASDISQNITALAKSGFVVATDAVEFLRTLPDEERPRLIEFIIETLTGQPDRPLVITTQVLQETLKPQLTSVPTTPSDSLASHPNTVDPASASGPETPIAPTDSIPPAKQVPANPRVSPSVQPLQKTTVSTGTKSWKPFAAEVDSRLNVVMTPRVTMTKGDGLEAFVKLFQDRYTRLSQIVRQQGLPSYRTIKEALEGGSRNGNSPGSGMNSENRRKRRPDELQIVGMVVDKRNTKKGNFLFTLEDPTETVKCIIHHRNIELMDQGERLLLDQVIGVEGRISNTGFMFVSNLFWPDVPLAHPRPARSDEPVSAVLISDLHVGSRECMEDALRRFILWLQGRVGGQREQQIAGRVKYIVIAGDLIDGIGVYPGQEKDLVIEDVRDQYQRVAELLQDVPEYIELVAIPGNHDTVRQALPQPAIPKHFAESLYDLDRLRLLGNPCSLQLHGIDIAVLHGDALNDLVQMLPGVDYNNPEKAMEALVRSRHMAPTYGASTLLAPEPQDCLVMDKVPHIVHAGHIHINSVTTYRDILLINSGTFQEQTEYMRMSGITPTPGVVPVVELDTLGVCQLSFTDL